MKIKTGKMLVFSLCLCLFTMFLGTYIYATTGKVTAETVRLREEASTDSNTVLLIAKDAEVEILEEDGEWYKVEYTEGSTTYTGYIRQDMLDIEGDSEEAEETTTEEETEENSSEEEIASTEETSDSQEEESQNDDETTEKETSSEENEEESQTEKVEEETSQIEEQTEITLLDDIKIRILPLINASTIGTIKAETEVFVTEIIGNWTYIESDSKSGWVLTSKLEIEEETSKEETKTEEENAESEEETETKEEEETEEETAETKELYVNVTTVNLREKASSSSDILTQLALNTKVTLVEEVDDTWSKVTVSGVTGYIASEYLSETETEETTTSRGSDETRTSSSSSDDDEEEETTTKTSSSSNSESSTSSSSSESTSSSSTVTGRDIVAYAKTLLGCKYVYGGTSPSGFDCSGFTQYVYAHFGYTIGRTSSSQRSNGTYVSKSNLQAGDLVCFSGHVGIYISNNQFIHAENASNGVTISSLTEAYYSRTYVTARRIID